MLPVLINTNVHFEYLLNRSKHLDKLYYNFDSLDIPREQHRLDGKLQPTSD